jgi:bifunctional non-homologous end joining protein LigD
VAKDEAPALLDVDGHEVRVTHPSKVYFADANVTKLDLVRYYLGASEGALRGVMNRPFVLKRFVHGSTEPPFYQKRAPEKLPGFMRTVTLRFPSGRTADEIVIDNRASLAWVVNLGCIELHPHPVRSDDLDHPDELRVDLDPGPGVAWDDVRKVALEVNALLSEHGLVAWPKTSGSRGMHILVRIERRYGFDEVREAALALAREIERRAPTIATSKWWKEERHGVFLDYNQNAKDRTTCSAYSVRPLPDARVSAPLRWDEVAACEPGDFTLHSMPARIASLGDLHAGIDETSYSIDNLIEWAMRDKKSGIADAPWPPHYRRRAGEAARVNPSRKKSEAKAAAEGSATGRRVSTMPLIVVAQAKRKEDALAGLERWRARHAEIAPLITIEDVLTDTMRGRSSTWTRIRINLRNVPEASRPPKEAPDPNEAEVFSFGRKPNTS